MKRIYKYTLEITDAQKLKLPSGSRILSVEEQNQQIVLYAVVDTSVSESLTDDYKIFIIGTGHCADESIHKSFIGTVKLAEGRLMFHVFYGLV